MAESPSSSQTEARDIAYQLKGHSNISPSSLRDYTSSYGVSHKQHIITNYLASVIFSSTANYCLRMRSFNITIKVSTEDYF